MTDYLRDCATALEGLPDRLSSYMTTARGAPVAGSPMEEAMALVKGRGHPAVDLIVDARNRAITAAEACAEHVLATARLLEPPARFYSGQVVARAAMEAAGLVRWLLDPGVTPDEIIARNLGRAREEQDRAITSLRKASVGTEDGRAQIATTLEDVIQMRERTVAAIAELGIEPVRAGPTELAKHGGEPEEYDIFSGSGHGRLGSFLETRKMAGDDAGSVILFLNLVWVVASAYVLAVQALHEFVTGAGIPPDVLAGIADSLGLKSDAFAAPDSAQISAPD